MLGKNKKLEEKMDTQVLNLQAMKQVASTEKKVKKKKNIALLLLFLGLFMIIMGILYPIIIDTVNSENAGDISKNDNNSTNDIPKENEETVVPDSTTMLSCTMSEPSEKVNKTTQVEFEFNSAGLIKYTITTNEVAVTTDGNRLIASSASLFNSTYGAVQSSGIEKRANLSPDNKNLTTVLSVDYEHFNVEQYNSNHPNAPFTVSYNVGTSKDAIQQLMVQQNASCQ